MWLEFLAQVDFWLAVFVVCWYGFLVIGPDDCSNGIEGKRHVFQYVGSLLQFLRDNLPTRNWNGRDWE